MSSTTHVARAGRSRLRGADLPRAVRRPRRVVDALSALLANTSSPHTAVTTPQLVATGHDSAQPAPFAPLAATLLVSGTAVGGPRRHDDRAARKATARR